MQILTCSLIQNVSCDPREDNALAWVICIEHKPLLKAANSPFERHLHADRLVFSSLDDSRQVAGGDARAVCRTSDKSNRTIGLVPDAEPKGACLAPDTAPHV